MEKFEEFYKTMLAEAINPKDFEKWLHEKNSEHSYCNNKYSHGLKDNEVYFCYQSGRECAQYSSKDSVEGIRIGSLRIRPQVAHGLSAFEAIDFAKEQKSYLLDGIDLSILTGNSNTFKALEKCGVKLNSNFIWTAESSRVEDMNLRRLSDAGISLSGIDNSDSKGMVIVKY